MDNNNQIITCGECAKCIHNLASDGIIAIGRNGKKAKILCANCYASYSSCGKCQYNAFCAFQSYSGPEPKIINQTIRKGNMVMQTQITNPKVIEKTCGDCLCYYHDLGCMRQQGYCGNLFVEGWDELPISVVETVAEPSSPNEVANSDDSNLSKVFPPKTTTIDSTGDEEIGGIGNTMREASQYETHNPDEDSRIAPQPQSQENTNAAKNSI